MLVIPRVPRTGRFQQPGGNAMRLERIGRALDGSREIKQLLHEFLFGRLRQHAEIDTVARYCRRVDLTDAEDAAHTGVRHLHVVHGVLFRLTACEIDIEHQLRVALAHEVEIPHGVTTHFVDEVAHGDV